MFLLWRAALTPVIVARHMCVCWCRPSLPPALQPWLARVVAGGVDVSVQQPVWGPDGSLYYVGDASGWWNIYRLSAQDLKTQGAKVGVVCVCVGGRGKGMWSKCTYWLTPQDLETPDATLRVCGSV